jgi:hypothetical protein
VAIKKCKRSLCSNQFEDNILTKKYCCEKCRKAVEKSRGKRRKGGRDNLPEFHHRCRVCLTVFRVSKPGYHVFCSATCREQDSQKKKEEARNREKPIIKNNCNVCNQQFLASRKLKYCSSGCKRCVTTYAARLKQYGISSEQHMEMIKRADEACEICAFKPSDPLKLNIDHDHKTGRVRGVLCGRCNSGLGQFLDNEDRLMSAIKYLRRD